jgi:phage terminase small subunit
MKNDQLTPQQERFVSEYLIDLNASAAYKRAGYKVQGKVADSAASRLLTNVKVRQAIDAAKAERAARTRIDADQVLANIARLAAAAEEARDFGAALKGNELVGKHLKLFTDKVEHSGAVTVEITRFGAPKEPQA